MKNLIEEFNNIELMRIFEIEVIDNKTQEKDYILFDISIYQNKLIAQHVGLTKQEEDSGQIAFKEIDLDECFSLDEHLQELHEECTIAIMDGELYELN